MRVNLRTDSATLLASQPRELAELLASVDLFYRVAPRLLRPCIAKLVERKAGRPNRQQQFALSADGSVLLAKRGNFYDRDGAQNDPSWRFMPRMPMPRGFGYGLVVLYPSLALIQALEFAFLELAGLRGSR